jgi:hypothetical protein
MQHQRRQRWRGQFPAGHMPLFQGANYGMGESWFGEQHSRLLPPESCLLIGWAQRSGVDPEIGQGRSLRHINRRFATMIHLITLPIETDFSRIRTLDEAFWEVTRTSEEPMLAGQGWQDPLTDYRNRRGTTEFYALGPGENTFALRPVWDPGNRALESLTIAFELEKKVIHQSNIVAIKSDDFKVALYDYEKKEWVDFGGAKRIVIPGSKAPKDEKGQAIPASRFYEPEHREMQMKIEVTDPQVKVGSSRNRPGVYNAFLRYVKITARLEPAGAGGP